jgi:hypothetical protein
MAKIPSSADMLIAIGKVAAGNWIDPDKQPGRYWCADLYNPDGRRVGDGVAETAAEACALAWVSSWSPDALVTGRVDLDLPFDTSGYRFVLRCGAGIAKLGTTET